LGRADFGDRAIKQVSQRSLEEGGYPPPVRNRTVHGVGSCLRDGAAMDPHGHRLRDRYLGHARRSVRTPRASSGHRSLCSVPRRLR
jgi:hypothetical protein